MAEFLETPRFPASPSFGFTATPIFDTTKIRTAGGQEDRNSPTEQPLWAMDFTVGPREEDEIQELNEWFNALGGEFVGFRVRNWADYKSCRINEDPEPTDQPLVALDTSPLSYQLVKRYTKGAKSRDLDILKPVGDTIRVGNHLGVEQASSRWTLDSVTGILVPLETFEGTPSTWGGEFDLPVRFDGDFPIEIVDYKIESVSFRLVQLRRP